MGRWKTFIALTVTLWIVPHAAAASEWTRHGWYLGVGGTWASSIFSGVTGRTTGGAVDLKSSGGINATAGYRLLSWMALELQYEWVQGIDGELLGEKVLSLESHTLTGNVRFILPTWRIQPYLLLGPGVTFTNFDSALGTEDLTAFAGRAGGGLDLYLHPNVVLFGAASVVLSTSSLSNIGIQDIASSQYIGVQAGLQYRF